MNRKRGKSRHGRHGSRHRGTSRRSHGRRQGRYLDRVRAQEKRTSLQAQQSSGHSTSGTRRRVARAQNPERADSAYAVQLTNTDYDEHIEWCNFTIEVSPEDAVHNAVPHTKIHHVRHFTLDWPRWAPYVPVIRDCWVVVWVRRLEDFGGHAGHLEEIESGTAYCGALWSYQFEVDCSEWLGLCDHEWHIYKTEKYANPYTAQMEGYRAIHRMGAAMRRDEKGSVAT